MEHHLVIALLAASIFGALVLSIPVDIAVRAIARKVRSR